MPAHVMSRRGFCLCCIGAAQAGALGWLTPREAYAEARGLVSLIKDSAAVAPIVTHKLRDNISVLEGSGGNVAVLTGPDGKVLIDAGISVSRPQLTKALADSAPSQSPTSINTHWHFDHTDGNAWLTRPARRSSPRKTRSNTCPRCSGWRTGTTISCPRRDGIPTKCSQERTSNSTARRSRSSTTVRRTPTATSPSHFAEADVVHVADTFWNGIYPFIDYSTGGSIDGMIAASEPTSRRPPKKRSSFRAMASPSATKPSSRISRHARRYPRQRRRAEEAGPVARREVAAKPTAPLTPSSATSSSTPASSPGWSTKGV